MVAPVKTQRDARFELLRLLCMFVIILDHFAIYSPRPETAIPWYNDAFLDFITVGGKVGVNCFILLSGYFQCKSKPTLKKGFKVWFEMFFWALALHAGTLLAGLQEYQTADLKQAFFPFSMRTWWFPTVYLTLYALTPVLNSALQHLPRRSNLACIGILYLMLNLMRAVKGSTGEFLFFHYILWFVCLYLAAGYLRLHTSCGQSPAPAPDLSAKPKYYSRPGFWLLLFAAGWLMVFFQLTVTLNQPAIPFPWFLPLNLMSKYMASPAIVLCSFSLFFAFACTKPIRSDAINRLATGAFGIYLIHEHPAVRALLWGKWVNAARFMDKPWFALFAAAVFCGVFLACLLPEFARIRVIEKPVFCLINRIEHAAAYRRARETWGKWVGSCLGEDGGS
ncbi:MAG: acyltransferase [Oscillospiraceae bacterium]|nr:acyltransferase [Oscillospiraceae bacterium]